VTPSRANALPPATNLPVAVTMGEPAGIGGEIALLAWARRRKDAIAPFFLIDDPERIAGLAKRLGLRQKIAPIADPAEAIKAFSRALPVLPIKLAHAVEPGRPDPANVAAVLAAIDKALDLARAGSIAALVTNPIHKATMYAGGFGFPGHTEYLAERLGAQGRPLRVAMMLAVPGLRVVPVTVHASLRNAIADLTADAIVAVAEIAAAALRRDFALPAPRLAVAGLNPHAGEDGSLGREEIEIVAPAIARLRRSGLDVVGPAPADTLFHAAARRRYDAAICLYHDQALIPLKTIDFFRGVNVTLGLPVVRTSPDHGTALDLAGRGVAKPDSLIAALRLAATIAANRRAGNAQAESPRRARRA
jgi:4-hydroxythreonine-4-phosphate dehydrogenase